MEILEHLGLALGFATFAGVNLYLTTFVAGLAIRFDWLALASKHEQLAILGDPWILGVAATLFIVEFFADKIPWVDSTWDVLHTIVRPAGGTLLALAALGELDPVVSVIAGLLAGSTSLTTHLAKTGSRLFLNLSPEPVSNIAASSAEDVTVLGGLGLMAIAPVPALFLCVLLVIAAGWIVWKTSGLLLRGWRKFRGRPSLEATS
ncbi:DUF4126 domain-containing protein [Roseibacillus ishigakijimensis]|uniref:DUF4126 domain-containing protein n=1 Tax=Roseibacillus ishigakijimensis TaxID=454146 RepID=A0A934VG41_9BACT|nr:DUF4126 domain-containing protein [Roseibacillus ishigakijimensis]MBK1832428.1 DUF4126 domain-containing protein [Roseibacillus ishigakijimensis]